ncbi:MAG: MFS transporter [Bacteroidales bacterium]|jgi:predicted MFS family arabinose efflux permease
METITNTLRDSKTARWTALAVISFTMLCGYYLTDVMAPLKPLLEKELLWNSAEYGFFTSAYGWFNVFLGMLIFGGIILDKMGVRFTGKMATIIMVLGTSIKYWAISTHALDGHLLLGMKAQVVIAGLGYATFGVGVETAGITVSKIIVKWFKGKEMALAMGLEMSTARIGTTLALATSIPIADALHGVSKPILICLIMLCIGMIAFFLYTIMDKRLDKSIADEVSRSGIAETEESFKVKDIWQILSNRGWWYIAILCLLFYSGVFPFIKFATDLMINKFNVTAKFAGLIPSMLTIGAIAMTPLFGNLYDRKGKGASIMFLGAFLLIFVHAMFSIPSLTAKPIAIGLIIILGVAFSLVPSAMWASVPKIIPERQLGTAYGMIFLVQNIGLSLVPLGIGWVLDKYCITGKHIVDGASISSYNYTIPMMIFTSLGIVALLFAFLLKAEDKRKGYGLELPNIKKENL